MALDLGVHARHASAELVPSARHQTPWVAGRLHSMRSPPPGHGPGAATSAHDTAAHTGPLSPRAALRCAVTTLLTSTSAGAVRFTCSINFFVRRGARTMDLPNMRSDGLGGFDVHRKQITFDYVDTDTGLVRWDAEMAVEG